MVYSFDYGGVKKHRDVVGWLVWFGLVWFTFGLVKPIRVPKDAMGLRGREMRGREMRWRLRGREMRWHFRGREMRWRLRGREM